MLELDSAYLVRGFHPHEILDSERCPLFRNVMGRGILLSPAVPSHTHHSQCCCHFPTISAGAGARLTPPTMIWFGDQEGQHSKVYVVLQMEPGPLLCAPENVCIF